MSIDRTLSVAVKTQANATINRILYLVTLTFANETVYVTSLPYNIPWNGNTYVGVGSLGSVSTISEGSEIEAKGISITLSGIPTQLLNDCESNFNTGGYAAVYLGFMDEWGTLTSDPIPAYVGMMDQPVIDLGPETSNISISVENRMLQLNRSRGGRYTDNQQRAKYPNDGSLKYVHQLQDKFIEWK